MFTADAAAGAVIPSQVGYQEDDDGGERRYCPAMGWDVFSQWCGIFQEWTAAQVGGVRGRDFPLLHYTPAAAQGYKDRGAWSLEPQYGAHVFFDWGGASLGSDVGLIDHIGFVLDASTWPDGWITTMRATSPREVTRPWESSNVPRRSSQVSGCPTIRPHRPRYPCRRPRRTP